MTTLQGEDRARMKTALLALLGSAIYATARYNVFKGVPWNDWPIYTLNKAFALSALFLLVLCVIHKRSAQGNSNARTMYLASVFGSIHVILSLTLLSPVYYEKLFVQGKLTAAAGCSIVLGAAAAAVMAVGKRILGDQDTGGGLGKLAILAFVIGLHAMLQGFAGWFALSKWPGMLPPITLISFLLGLAAVAIALCPKRTA
jgi:hypothetical protein